ncbi:hypothetical protein CC78DRAFT_514882, partial [Lojkania enalia]
YINIYAFIACFFIASPALLEKLQDTWIPEGKSYSPNTPIDLVGCRTEACGDPVIV